MQELISSLANGRVVVTFTKADGTERTMIATTNPALIPGIPPGGIPERTRFTPALITVWDLDLGQWRSFKEDRVITWRVA